MQTMDCLLQDLSLCIVNLCMNLLNNTCSDVATRNSGLAISTFTLQHFFNSPGLEDCQPLLKDITGH